MDAVSAARAFVDRHFDGCEAALLGGSTARGDATPTSDLDIVVISEIHGAPYRESFRENGWPIEAFVHDRGSLKARFDSDVARRRPSLPRMCRDGIVLRDPAAIAAALKAEGSALMALGPGPLGEEEQTEIRYFLTDALDDFLGSPDPAIDFILAANILQDAANLILGVNRRWQGKGKWVEKALREYDPALADSFAAAIAEFEATKSKTPVVTFVDLALDAAGGRLWEGFSAGKRRD
jgi:hypothetical protein